MIDRRDLSDTIFVTRAALERTSPFKWFGRGYSHSGGDSRGLILRHIDDAVDDGPRPCVLRGSSSLFSLDAERLAFAVAANVAHQLCRHLSDTDAGLGAATLRLLKRHPAASRFLLMNDIVGVLRPLTDLLSLEKLGKSVVFPTGENVARNAMAELAARPVKVGGGSPFRVVDEHFNSDELVHLVDAASPFKPPASVKPSIVLEPRQSPHTPRSAGKLYQAYKFLKRSGIGHHVSLLLAHSVHRFLNHRLALFATFDMDEVDLTKHPVVYWTNMSLRSVFHASERRACGLTTIAAHTILVDHSERYACDVFDAVFTHGTGQGFAEGVAARGPLARQMGSNGGVDAPILIAMQPSNDIMRAQVAFARRCSSLGVAVVARPHPLHRRNIRLRDYWLREMGVNSLDGEQDDLSKVRAVVTGTSNFALEACLAGVPVIHLCPTLEIRRLWPDTPSPGHILQPERLAGLTRVELNEVVELATQACNTFNSFYSRLPLLNGLAPFKR